MKIKPGPASKRTSVHSYQITFLVKSIQRLEDVYARHFREITELTPKDFNRFRKLEEYRAFMEAAVVCGFVCNDFKNNFPVDEVHGSPRMLSDLPFQKLRQYIHTIQRTEKWCSEYSTALFDSLKTGALVLVANRLASDESLVESEKPAKEYILLDC